MSHCLFIGSKHFFPLHFFKKNQNLWFFFVMETNRKLLVGARGVFEHAVPNCCKHQLNYWRLTLESLLLIVFSCFLFRFLLYVQSLNTFLILLSKDTSIIIEMFSFLQYTAYTAKAKDSITRFRLQDIVFKSNRHKCSKPTCNSELQVDSVREPCRGFLQLWAAEVCLIQPEKASAFDVWWWGLALSVPVNLEMLGVVRPGLSV